MRTAFITLTVLFLLVVFLQPTQAQVESNEEGNIIIDIVLPLSLAFIMFSLGLGLTLEDFSLVFREPKAFGIGVLNQMIFLPIVGFSIATLANLEGELAVGLMILACCPGGVTSNILTKLARGDTALSISYTAVISLLTVFSLPLIVSFSMEHFMGESAPNIDIISLAFTMFLLTTVPVSIGIAFRKLSPKRADFMESSVNSISACLFVIIVLAAIISEWNTLMENIGTLGPAVIALNLIMLTIGFQSAKLLDLEEEKATTVSIESGIQNATVGIAIGGMILASQDGGLSTLSLPSGVYGVLMYVVIAPFMYWRIASQRNTTNAFSK